MAKLKTTPENLLFYFTFALFSLGQIGRFSFYGQQINVYVYEILVFWVLLVLWVKYKFDPLKNAFKNSKFIFIFLFFLFFSFLLSLREFQPFENFVSFLYFVRLIVYFGCFFYLSYHIEKNPQFRTVIRKGVSIFILITIVTSGLQYFLYPNLRNLEYLGWDPHLYRLFGLFFDSSIAAAIYGLLFLYVWLGKGVLRTVFLGIFFLFIILTFSRIAYVAILVSFIAVFVAHKKIKELFLFVVLFLIGVILVPKPFGESVNLQRTFSLYSRIEDYRSALQIWLKKPVLGYGYNRIRYSKRKLNLIESPSFDISHSGASFHSSYLVILVTGGIAGLIFFILSLFRMAVASRVAKFYLIFLAVISLGDNILLHPFILFLLFTILSLES